MNDQVTPQETATILEIADQCLELEGDYVELGCYKGDTSVLLGKILQDWQKKCSPKIANSPTTEPSTIKPHTIEPAGINPEISTEIADFSTRNAKLSTENGDLSTEADDFSTKNSNFSTKSQEFSTGKQRRLWIYDSFAGLPEKSAKDFSGAGANFKAGELLVTKREVVDKLRRAGLHNVIIKKAWFSDLTPTDLPEKIAFAFLDGDLYDSIKTSLGLVLPLLAPRGVIIVHDYNNSELPGASRAVDEFLARHPEFRLKVQHRLAILTRK